MHGSHRVCCFLINLDSASALWPVNMWISPVRRMIVLPIRKQISLSPFLWLVTETVADENAHKETQPYCIVKIRLADLSVCLQRACFYGVCVYPATTVYEERLWKLTF